MLTTDRKKWNELTYTEKHSRCNRIRAICSRGDIVALKELIPTTEELLAYNDMSSGGSFLHTLMYSGESITNTLNQVEFLQQVFKEYGLHENEEARRKLLLRKNARGKYAADFTYVLKYRPPEYRAKYDELVGKTVPTQFAPFGKTVPTQFIPYRRTDFEKNKGRLYTILKNEILRVRPPAQKSDVHKIGHDYTPHEQHSTEKSGTPTTGGIYIPDKDGNPALYILGSIRETYPVIKLRNIDEYGDDVAIIENLDPNSPKGLREQVFEKIDFPDDFIHHFTALKEFEQTYQNMRSNPNQFAFMRNFVQKRGSLIFEDRKDHTIVGNSNSGGYYAGYARISRDKDTGTMFPVIVIRSDYYGQDPNRIYSTLLHELYHRVDLGAQLPLSYLPITECTFMLAEQSPNNPLKSAFEKVNTTYPPSEYAIEVIAQLMSVKNKDLLSTSPLLKQFHNLGEMFAKAQTDNCPALAERIRNACITLPKEELEQLQIMYREFRKAKEEQFKREEEIRKAYSGAEAQNKIWQSRQKFNKTMAQQNQANEPQRKALEAKISRCILSATQHAQYLLDNPQLGRIVMPPIAYKVTATSARPIEEAIAPYYEKQPNIETLAHCTRRLSSFKNLQKSEEISPFYASELIKVAYVCERLYKEKGHKGCLPEPLPSFSKMDEQTFKTNPDQIVKSLRLFIRALDSGANETQLRASIFCNKPVAELTGEDFLRYNINDALNKRYVNKSTSVRNYKEINAKITKGLKTIFMKAGYKKEDMPDFFAISKENGKNPPFYQNIETLLPLIKQGYSPEVLKEVFTIAATSRKNADTLIERYINSVPDSDKYKKMTITNNRTNV